jgi:succinoglycan biosynthesis transport protein ExoP
MTTLPQTTTTIRLPRSNNGPVVPVAGVGAPGGGAAGVPGHAAPGLNMTGSDVWRVIRSNLWLILGLLVLSAALGYGAFRYLAWRHSSFTATGFIQIQAATLFNPLKAEQTELSNQTLEIEQNTHARQLRHEALVSRLLQTPNKKIRETGWFRQFVAADGRPDTARAKEDLLENFSVTPLANSKLLAVQMSYSNPTDSRDIVVDIVEQYLEEQRSVNTDKQLNRGAMLSQLKRKHEMRLADLSQELRQKANRLSIDGMGAPGRLSAREVELAELLKAQFEMQANATKAKAQYEQMVTQARGGQDPPMVEEAINRDDDVQFQRQQVNALDAQADALSVTFGPDHKDMQRVRKMRESAQQKLDQARDRVRVQTTAMLAEELANQKDATEAQLKLMNEKIAAVKADLGDLNYAMAEYLTKKDEEVYYREQLKQVTDQQDALSQMENQRDFSSVAWSTKPEVPDRPSFPKLSWVMGFAVLLGLGLGLGIAFLRELMDTSVRSPRDIARVGQLNLLGMIPHESDDPQAAGAPLPLIIAQAPHSMLAEQFRQVRTRLQHSAALDATRSILVTSPGPGDGKSTVACNLAIGLALNGRRILLVDANFRRPELHRVFNLGSDAGFSTALADPEHFASAVVATQIPNLSVLPLGPRPGNPTELLESQLLIDFIERALEEYDHVVFDSGPLLLASESIAMAPRVDGVITVVRARANSRGLLGRMRDELRKLKAEHLGVVLNAVRAQAGGYYNRNMKTYYAYQNGHAA